jgi:hypothetical protein
MMKFQLLLVCLQAVAACAAAEAATPEKIAWHDAREFTIEGRGWDQTDRFYDRFPAKAKESICKMNDYLWYLSGDSSGMLVRFKTDAVRIQARWKLTSPDLALPHMPATGVSGLDLYVKYKGGWRWLALGQPTRDVNEAELITGMSKESREYQLYLPLYNGVSSVEIGVPEGTVIEALPRPSGTKPVVFYGTSITQGACASRPGMSFPAIVGRRLDVPIVDLGFSGSGRCEPEVADLLTDLDPRVFVIDCMANMDLDKTNDRIRYLLKGLHAKHPETPVVLVENVVYGASFIYEDRAPARDGFNQILKKIYDDSKAEWKGKLFYVSCAKMLGTDGESAVDGVHPSDLGLMRMADVITPVVKKALKAAEHP